MAKKEYDGLKLYEESAAGNGAQETKSDDNSWNELKELTDMRFHDLLDILKKQGWQPPEAGYELEGAEGEVVGSAELAWEALKLAFLTDEELDYQQLFTNAGWNTFSINNVLDEPDKYIHLKDDKGEWK